jgi:hypothetical protein
MQVTYRLPDGSEVLEEVECIALSSLGSVFVRRPGCFSQIEITRDHFVSATF